MENSNSGSDYKVARLTQVERKRLTQVEIELRAIDCLDLVNIEDNESFEPELADHDFEAYLLYLRDVRIQQKE